MSDDFSGVSLVYDKPEGYNKGDAIKLTLVGEAVSTVQSVTTETLIVSTTVVAPDDSVTVVNAPPVVVTTVTDVASEESVRFDSSVPVTDGSGRAWAFSEDGLSVTSTA